MDTSGALTTWCIRYQTRTGSGQMWDLSSVILISRNCLRTGWGHDSPGHARHIRARTAQEALQKAFGLPPGFARRWLESGNARQE